MKKFFWIGSIGLLGLLGWILYFRFAELQSSAPPPKSTVAAVQVAEVRVGQMSLRRQLSGTLDSPERVEVSAKVGGRIAQLRVDVGDALEKGQTVLVLDAEEYRQDLRRAEAELAVAKAQRTEAESALEIARREMKRIEALIEGGIASAAQVDITRAQSIASEAAVEVASAQVQRAEAARASAALRLAYTELKAEWRGSGTRYVASRAVTEGDLINANNVVFTMVSLDPLTVVIHISERDYGLVSLGQKATIRTEAYPGETFEAEVSRVAPVFGEESRQARVELVLENRELRLKPGMFVRAELVLDTLPSATMVPLDALVERNGETGVFVVNPSGDSVRWHTVQQGIRDGNNIQIFAEGVTGQVVTMGQQLIADGSKIVIPDQQREIEVREGYP